MFFRGKMSWWVYFWYDWGLAGQMGACRVCGLHKTRGWKAGGELWAAIACGNGVAAFVILRGGGGSREVS